MPVPTEDRLDYQCRQDMRQIETSVATIRAALQKVTDLMGADTWVGDAADRWATDFTGRKNALSRLFDSYPAEEQRLITKAQQDQAKLNNPGHTGS
ncbi:hypothetical protein [Streptomyces sp. NBC_01190]|uniref:hypothetical protein n=1 Tax=Streptomyces sp. NBC_01190 TaxID=2903767 RepID=UPI00386B17E0|nr:hypothetical protein OG519_09325 [Streptomyces sp. NBC_01190]